MVRQESTERRSTFTPFLVVIGLMAATSLALAYTVDTSLTNEAGIEVMLPDRVGNWSGEELLSCQNSDCRKQFGVGILEEPHVCPACEGISGQPRIPARWLAASAHFHKGN